MLSGLNSRNLFSGGWEVPDEGPGASISGESSLSGLQMTTFLLHPHMAEREQALWRLFL